MEIRTLDYKTMYDKIYGCWIGKTLGGTIGAPFEGIKVGMNLKYDPKMLDVMLPNDDLDLQILWLDVLKKKGLDFTSEDLLKNFVKNCDYSPGEYAVMRKNCMKGIYPPYSGIFCNDYYAEGMGSPIRSELWACTLPANPEFAAKFAVLDAQLDHKQASIDGERFFAALESAAFYESNIYELIDIGLKYVTKESKLYNTITKTVNWAKQNKNSKAVLNNILTEFGHPDCTNVFQNIGIIMLALIHGENDFIKTSMIAINSGFDTDCTCATAASILGLINGSEYFGKYADIDNLKYVLGVKLEIEDTSIKALTKEVADMAVIFSGTHNKTVTVANAPEIFMPAFESSQITVNFDYEGIPSIDFDKSKKVSITIQNNQEKELELFYELTPPEGIECDLKSGKLTVPAGNTGRINAVISVKPVSRILMEKNLIHIVLKDINEVLFDDYFGVSGAFVYKATGPFWKTKPTLTDEQIIAKPYINYLGGKDLGETYDNIRNFHVNFAVDDDLGKFSEHSLFNAVEENKDFEGYGQFVVSLPENSFEMSELIGLEGSCVLYLSGLLYSPEETECCMQVGHSDSISLFLNEEKLLEKTEVDFFTSENTHLTGVKIRKGINKIKLKLTRQSMLAKYSIIFSKEPSCSEHIVSFGMVNPKYFNEYSED